MINETSEHDQLAYSYDAVGNRLNKQSNTELQELNNSPISNQLTDIDNNTVSYSEQGNITSRTINGVQHVYEYDANNRYVALYINDDLIADYQYSPLEERVSKQLYENEQLTERHLFTYDLSGQLISVNKQNAAGQLLASIDYIWLDNMPVAQITDVYSNGTVATTEHVYIHADHLNTPELATDQNQNTVWQWQRDGFGSGNADQDPDGDAQNVALALRLPGQYYDQESGLYYNYFRDYDPSLGRYVQSDPIGLAGGLNTYGYAYQNPITYFDPDGKRPTKNPKGPNGRPLPQGEGSIGFQIGSTVMNYNPKDGATWSQTTGLGIGFFGEQCKPAPPEPEQCSISDKKPDSYSVGWKGLGVTVKSNGQKCITVGPAIGIPVGAEWDI